MDMTIRVSDLEEMVDIVCHLVKRGFAFKVVEDGAYWLITLTGGF